MQPIVLVVGTRPEGIKMIPIYKAFKSAGLPVILCSTMQHDELLKQVFDLFEVQPDFDLKIMRQGQDLFYLTQSILQKTKTVFREINPAMVVVQGDTTSTMAAALSAFYLHIPVCHIEAGLRTDDIHAPFPEEMNRRVVSSIADVHCAPTAHATAQLLAEGVNRKAVFCTGNTVVDALRIAKKNIQTGKFSIDLALKKQIESCKKQNKKIMLLTAHRRESFDGGIVRILQTVKQFLSEHDDVFCVYPFHPNPSVVQAIESVGLSDVKNMYLCEPVLYKELTYLLLNVDWVMTDSGGIQEEAVSLSKPVLVLREKTERAEGVWSGLATMVGTDSEKIRNHLMLLVSGKNKHVKDVQLQVYGDGYASEKIVQIIGDFLSKERKEIVEKKVTQPIINSVVNNPKKNMNVSSVGLGYIGLPTAIILAEAGLKVSGFDVDEQRVQSINKGESVIDEPELFERLNLVLQSGFFTATTSLQPADCFVVAVPTPFKEEKKADLSFVYSAAESIASVLQKGNLVILESTVPVGATEKLAEKLEKITGLSAKSDFFVAHCPERVLPGKIFHELVYNARVIGGVTKQATEKAKQFYYQFVQGQIHTTDVKTAEMVKLVENSSRDVELAFVHQVASMAYDVGLNPYEVVSLANKHPRVNLLKPSCGVGGHCIAVDPWFLVESFPNHSCFLKSARQVNDAKPGEVVDVIQREAKRFDTKPSVLLLGLTYKPNVDDLRESPAINVAKMLQKEETVTLLVSEPHVQNKLLQSMFGESVVSAQDGISQADIVVFLVAHTRFKAIDKKLLANKVVLDFCGILYKEKDEHFIPAREAKDSGAKKRSDIAKQQKKEMVQ